MIKSRFIAGLLLVMVAVAPVVLAAPGDTVKTIPAPYRCPQGLAFDGKHLWSVDRYSDMIYRIDTASGGVLDSIPTPGYVPSGLTWDGSRLWCVDAETELIYAINPKTRIIEQTISCPVSKPCDLAWDGVRLWVAGDNQKQICQISIEDGTTITSIPAPALNANGLTFDGTYLWVADRVRNMIYMVTPDRGDVVICFPAPGPHSLGLAWDGKALWNVDYQTDRIYKLVVDDGTIFTRKEEKAQRVEFINQVRNFGPDTLQTLDIYLAVPQNLNNQDLVDQPVFDPAPTDFLTDRWGQKVAHFQLADVAPLAFATARMTVSAKLYQTRYFVFPEKVGGGNDIPKPIRDLYLADDTKFSLQHPVIQKAVQEAVGEETNLYWIARKIYNYVIDHMEYELAGGWNVAPAVLERGNGSCSEYSFVYIAMCRASGLPARYAGSVVVRGDDASYDDVFHRWVEIYLPKYGWLPVDPSGGDSPLPADRANYFGHLGNRYLITTLGGGGSEYLGWGYNANERWTSKGRCKVESEQLGEWTPLNPALK
jgi:transglutaminase-like putative cysteine protease/sugar lactone lactonase YvrE